MKGHRTYQIQTMHLMDAQASVEGAFCKSKVDADDLTSVQYYLRCRLNTLSVPTVCSECKVVAVTWIEDYCSGLKADVSALRGKVEGLLEMVAGSRGKTAGDQRAVEQAARDTERFERSVERAESEADDLQEEARVCRQLVEQLRTEIGPLS